MLGDALEHVSEIGFWIDAVELGRADQGVDPRGPLPARVGTGKKMVLAAEGDCPQSPFGGYIVPSSDTQSA